MNFIHALVSIILFQLSMVLAGPIFHDMATAGEDYGIKIWKIDEEQTLEPQIIPTTNVEFRNKDAYIVLMMCKLDDLAGWNIHYVLGPDASDNEINVAIQFTVELGSTFRNEEVYYREVLGRESALFKSYFPHIYKPEKHILRDPRRLYQIKGKNRVQISQIPLNKDVLTNDDCYYLDQGFQYDVIVFCGSFANNQERSLTNQVTKAVIEKEHHGCKSRIREITYFNKYEDFAKDFFAEFGSSGEDPAEIPLMTELDEDFERRREKEKHLIIISKQSGKIMVDDEKKKPMDLPSLKDEKCYVLESKSAAGVIIMLGEKANVDTKIRAFRETEKIIRSGQNYSGLEQVQILDDRRMYKYV